MGKLTKEEKAIKLLENDGVFYRGNKNGRLYFIVKGSKNNNPHEVFRENRGGRIRYICDCDHALHSYDTCSHILACEIYAVRHKLLDGGATDENNYREG